MAVITIGLADAKNNFSRLTTEVHNSGKPVTVMKNNKPWVVIQPIQHDSPVDIALDFMDEYSDIFEKLAQ